MGLMNYIGNFLEERRELSNEKKKKNDVLFEKLSRIPIEKWIYKNHFYSFSSYTRSFLTTLEDGAELCITRNESDLGSSYSMQVNNTPLNDDDYFSDSIRGIFSSLECSYHSYKEQKRAGEQVRLKNLKDGLLDKLLNS